MQKEIFCGRDIVDVLQYAKEHKCKLTVFSQGNADEGLYSSNERHIRIVNRMNRILEINLEDQYVVVESGVTWLQLIEELDHLDYTIYSSQSGLTFSIGGSFCGNAHGRKTEYPMIQETILSFDFYDGYGREHTVHESNPLFHAMAGSLGLLGIITRLTLKIKKKYGVVLRYENLPLHETSVAYIHWLHFQKEVCMINFQTSYFEEIPEILLCYHVYEFCGSLTETVTKAMPLDPLDISLYTTNWSLFFTFVLLLFSLFSRFSFLNTVRWNIEKHALKASITHHCKNVNNSFDNWSKPYIREFRIIEFFFKKADYMYCQSTCMRLFRKHGMYVLSSGSRIVYERKKTKGFMRFSHSSSQEDPYFSLVIDFFANDRMTELTQDIREHILQKRIPMTYHTTYNWNFTRKDIRTMFPGIDDFVEIKKRYDPHAMFTNVFFEKYMSPFDL